MYHHVFRSGSTSGVPRCTIDAIRSIRAVDFALSILIRSYDIYSAKNAFHSFAEK